MKAEHQKEAQLAFDVATAKQSTEAAMEKTKRANRRTKLLGCTSLVLVIFLLISTGLNVASQLYIGELQKETFIDAQGHMAVKQTGKVASMEAAHFQAQATTLYDRTDEALNTVESIKLVDAYGATENYKITGFSRKTDAVIFHTARGTQAIQVDSSGKISLVDPSTGRQLFGRFNSNVNEGASLVTSSSSSFPSGPTPCMPAGRRGRGRGRGASLLAQMSKSSV